uniref:Ubiquitin-like protease family profile domain-containing protein n=1 Tax=Oryza punctata TaxID=4537 RepID=A0A0E0KCY5_ORYPU
MGGTDDFTMQCILMILFSKLLAPESSTDITGNIVNMVSKNLELYKDMALCKFVVDHLRWSAERWKSGKRSTVYGCTTLLVVYYLDNLLCKAMISNTDTPRSQFFNSSLIDKIENLTKSTKKDGSTSFGKLNLRCRESTCYFVSKEKVKGKVGAGSGSTRKRKHINELAAQEATVARSKEAPHFGGDFPSLRSKLGPLVESLGSTRKQIGLDTLEQYDKEVEQIMGNLHKAQDRLVNVLTSLCSTSDPKIAYTQKSKKRRDGLPPLDSHAVTYKTSGSGNENTTQASIGTPSTQANDVLGDEQSRGNVESSLPMHVEDPKDAEAGQPCEPATDAHNDSKEVLNSENHNLAFSFDAAVNIISRECKSFDLPNAKLIFPSMINNDHWTVFCFNFNYKRIDILDSLGHDRDEKALKAMKYRVVGRFLDVLDVMFPKKFTDVRKWKCYPACTQKQVLTNDCGFLAMKYIQLWDGKVFVKKVCPKDGTKYHAEALYYILFHPLNEAKLPAAIERYRPKITKISK